MATQKPISTISYNTKSFLLEKLKTWYEAHTIQAYMLIFHKGEDGDKDHFHVRIEPNKKLDPMDLTEMLKEYSPDNSKPLGCRPWRPSKEEDWYMYVVHDKEYLNIKYGGGEKGEKLPYKWQDIIASEGYDTEVAFIRAKQALERTAANMVKRLQQGDSALTLLAEGQSPFLINSVLRTLSTTDYEKLQSEFGELQKQYFDLLDTHHKLVEQIELRGFIVSFDNDNNPILDLNNEND
jgi:hypothetical protein